MKKSSKPTQTSASAIAPRTVATGANGGGSERAAGSAAMQYEKVPRKIPSVHCVTRSLEKLTMMRGENCIDARVSVISRMANTIDTTVMMEAAMPARMTWATCGSACEGNRTVGTHALAAGNSSSKQDRTAPAQPSASAIVRGRIKKPPRRSYTAWRKINGRLLLTISSSVADQTRAHKEKQRVPPSCSIQWTGFAKGIETLQPYKRPCQPISRLQGQACGGCRRKPGIFALAGCLTTPTSSGSKIHDGSPIPQQPVSPNRIVVTGFGLGVGLLLGSVAAKVRCPTNPGAA